jgi:hypothetical protein
VALDDELDVLREAFYSRLQRDRVELTVFAAALTRDDGDSLRVFERLRQFAHKTRGMSAMFQSLDVANAARSLENAAAKAASAHAQRSDPTVWAALVELMDVLAKLRPNHASKSSEVSPS